jgi:hypothetical protein
MCLRTSGGARWPFRHCIVPVRTIESPAWELLSLPRTPGIVTRPPRGRGGALATERACCARDEVDGFARDESALLRCRSEVGLMLRL